MYRILHRDNQDLNLYTIRHGVTSQKIWIVNDTNVEASSLCMWYKPDWVIYQN